MLCVSLFKLMATASIVCADYTVEVFFVKVKVCLDPAITRLHYAN